MIHELKTWREPFRAIWRGEKRFEIRKADRAFCVGDGLKLNLWDPEREEYQGSYWLGEITYICHGGEWGLPDDLCVLSIRSAGE